MLRIDRRRSASALRVLHGSAPPVLPACGRPNRIGLGRIPRRNVDSVGHMADRHLRFGPSWKQALRKNAGLRAMQTADAVDRSAAANREIGHIEWLGFSPGFARPSAINSRIGMFSSLRRTT